MPKLHLCVRLYSPMDANSDFALGVLEITPGIVARINRLMDKAKASKAADNSFYESRYFFHGMQYLREGTDWLEGLKNALGDERDAADSLDIENAILVQGLKFKNKAVQRTECESILVSEDGFTFECIPKHGDIEVSTYDIHQRLWDIIQRHVQSHALGNPANNDNDLDLGHDLKITRTTRRTSGGGTWVSGTLHGHCFEALVFAEHATNPGYEIADSRISKLSIQRMADKTTVFNWDRGIRMPAGTPTVQAIVDFLCEGLAQHTYGN